MLIFLITVSLIVAYGARCTATVLDRFPDAIHPLIQMLLAFNMLVVVLGPFILVGLVIARSAARTSLAPGPGSGPADEVTAGPKEDGRDSDAR